MTVETAPVTTPIEVVTPIKPSEAIRLGCLTTRQYFGSWGQLAPDGTVEACALGAMSIGYGDGKADDDPWVPADGTATDRFWRTTNTLPCPVCGVGFAVECLNDDHRWSRERIADWLEGLGL